MEKNLVWFQNLDYQSPNLNSLVAEHCIEQPNSTPFHMKPNYSEGSPNGSVPSFAFTGLPQSRESPPNEISSWFYCLPRFRQAFGPVLNSMPEQKLPTGTIESIGGRGNSTFGLGHTQKRFLVFDQSGDQTTLLYSSGINSPVPCLNDWNYKPPLIHNWLKQEPAIKKDTAFGLEPFLVNELDEENQKDGIESDMHEDTEEMNALLYSDDEYSEDDEETSTGHSPSTMTANRMQDWFEAQGEEVASSAGSTKRQKLSNGGYGTPSAVMDFAVMDTASSMKHSKSEPEEDAESSCGNGVNEGSRGFSPVSGKKRSRKESIRETVCILQKIIPDGKGKDAVVIIDEAIHYLKSLKARAKDFGLDAL